MSVRRLDNSEYRVIVQDEDGNVVNTFLRVARQAIPTLGALLFLDKKMFRVVDVHHVDENSEEYLPVIFTGILIYAESVESADEVPTSTPTPRRPRGRGGLGTKSSPLNVVGFRRYPIDADSTLLPLFCFIAVVIQCVYLEQAQMLETLKAEAAQLQWDGRYWVMAQLSDGVTPEELRHLSRAAKRQAALAGEFATRLANTKPVERPSVLPDNVVELAAFRR